MTKYVKKNGKWYDARTGEENEPVSVIDWDAPVTSSVHVDTMDTLKHPVTGEYYTSKSEYLKECRRLNLEIVPDSEKFSTRGNEYKDKITEALVMDRIERAEAIVSDPAKLRERHYQNERILERRERLLNGRS